MSNLRALNTLVELLAPDDSETVIARAADAGCSAAGCTDGWIFDVDDAGYSVPRRCSCQDAGRIAQMITAARIPQVFIAAGDTRTGPPGQAEAVNAIRQILSKPVPVEGLLMFGAVGTGKSHLLSMMGLTLARRRTSVLWQDMQRLQQRTFDSFGRHAELSRGELVERLVAPRLLLIDDLVKPEAKFVELFSEVLDRRDKATRPTAMTTNLEMDEHGGELCELYGHRAWSRIRGRCRLVEVTGEDMRPEKGVAAQRAPAIQGVAR